MRGSLAVHGLALFVLALSRGFAAAQAPIPDPTKPSPAFEKILQPKVGPGQMKLPALVLKGRVLTADKKAAALLEVDGRLAIVSRDSMIGGPGVSTIKVIDVTAQEVLIEIGPGNERISLR